MSEDITDYLAVLGKLALMSQLLSDEQKRLANTGMLNMEEFEQSESIEWLVVKLLAEIEGQVRLVSERTPVEWEEILKQIGKKLNEGESNEQHT